MERNHICSFEEGHHGEHLCEIWTSGSRDVVIDIYYLENCGPAVLWTGTICGFLEEGIIRNNPVKLF